MTVGRNPLSDPSTEKLQEKCAVFGVFVPEADAAPLAIYGLWALQHRGQEASGIVSSDGRKFYRHAAAGLVSEIYDDQDINLPGNIAIGHNRYSTSGGVQTHHIQPLLDKERSFAFAHNGNIPDCSKMIKFLGQRGIDTRLMSDSGMMSTIIGYYIDEENLALELAIQTAWPLFTGVFSAVAMTPGKLVAFRDKRGIRPLSIGTLDGGGFVVASETCAFHAIGAEFLRDVLPGEMIVIDANGLNSIQVEKGSEMIDIFELVYFARPDSVISGLSVHETRKNFGRQMAREFPIDADLVVPVPDSAIPAALGYAEESGIPFDMALVKNRYIHRTFIYPSPEMRERNLTIKLSPVVDSIKGKSIILVDDSIVRGSTMRKLVQLIKKAGATEVHIAVSSPPVKFPDFYGINTPTMSELIAANMTDDQIRDHVGATSLNYLSLDGMVKATGRSKSHFNTSCFDGVYPISIGARSKSLQAESPTKIAILASGSGTTAEKIIRAVAEKKIPAEIALVIASRPTAGIIERVNNLDKELNLNIKVVVVGKSTHPPAAKEKLQPGEMTKSEEKAVLELLKKNQIDLVLLLGYMKKVSPRLCRDYGWRDDFHEVFQARMLNTHPGLLPETAGLHGVGVQEFVLKNNLKQAGQTLHIVSAEYDAGPTIAEHRSDVLPHETADELFARVQKLEKDNIAADVRDFIVEQKKFFNRGGNCA